MPATTRGEQLFDRGLQHSQVARELLDLRVAVGNPGVALREQLLQPLDLQLQFARRHNNTTATSREQFSSQSKIFVAIAARADRRRRSR